MAHAEKPDPKRGRRSPQVGRARKPEGAPAEGREPGGAATEPVAQDGLRPGVAEAPPTRVRGYVLEGEIGRGGMGVVYRGRDERLGRAVAIKMLPRELRGDPLTLARLEREAKLLAKVQHPNIAVIYALEASAGQLFLILEYVPGETLAERLGRGALPLPAALEVLRLR
jgi:serine/threonine protein kinase